MIDEIDRFIRAVRAGEPASYERLTIVPLLSGLESPLDYLVLDDAIEKGLLEIGETAGGGRVPELVVHSVASLPVLVPDGTALVGGRQNRVVNLSILLPPRSDTVIPVSCVEQGRWSSATEKSARPRDHADTMLRGFMCAGVNESAGRSDRPFVSQSGVWCHVKAMLEQAKAHSATGDYHATFRKAEASIAEYEKRFPYPQGASGAAVLIDGWISSVDIFDRPEVCRRLWPKLLRGYVLGSFCAGPKGDGAADVRTFLEEAAGSSSHRLAAIGMGTSLRLTAPRCVGAALLGEDSVVHLSLFADAKPRRGPEGRSGFRPVFLI